MKTNSFTTILFFSFSFFFVNLIQSQDYRAAFGLRLGAPSSISAKLNVSENMAFEGTLGIRRYSSTYRNTSISAAVLRRKNFDFLDDIDGLSFYYGGGIAVFFWNQKGAFSTSNLSVTNFGIQAYTGVEYTFSNLPINVTLDWVPTLTLGNAFFGYGGFSGGYGALGVRYIVGRP